jgi:hypothetical protein
LFTGNNSTTTGSLVYTQQARLGVNKINPSYTLDVAGTISGTAIAIGGPISTAIKKYNTGTNAAAGAIVLDLNAAPLQTIYINGNVSFTTANRAPGRAASVRISGDGTARNYTFDARWKFVGEKPTSIAASKIALLSLTCYGTSEQDVICMYGVQD